MFSADYPPAEQRRDIAHLESLSKSGLLRVYHILRSIIMWYGGGSIAGIAWYLFLHHAPWYVWRLQAWIVPALNSVDDLLHDHIPNLPLVVIGLFLLFRWAQSFYHRVIGDVLNLRSEEKLLIGLFAFLTVLSATGMVMNVSGIQSVLIISAPHTLFSSWFFPLDWRIYVSISHISFTHLFIIAMYLGMLMLAVRMTAICVRFFRLSWQFILHYLILLYCAEMIISRLWQQSSPLLSGIVALALGGYSILLHLLWEIHSNRFLIWLNAHQNEGKTRSLQNTIRIKYRRISLLIGSNLLLLLWTISLWKFDSIFIAVSFSGLWFCLYMVAFIFVIYLQAAALERAKQSSLYQSSSPITDPDVLKKERKYASKGVPIFVDFIKIRGELVDKITIPDIELIRESVVYCVDGRWGAGKSSLLGMMEQIVSERSEYFPWKWIHKHHKRWYDLLPKKNPSGYIWINFNPLHFSNSTELIQDFFNTIDTEISAIYGRGLGKQLGRYVELVTPHLDTDWRAGIAGAILDLLPYVERYPSLNKLKEEIKERISSIRETIVIVLDDIDRMQPEEILTVLKLVKLISGFPRIIFLLSMDYDRVASIITRKCGHEFANYLQKFIDKRYVLPSCTYEELRAIFFWQLSKYKDSCNDALKDTQINLLFDHYIMEVNVERMKQIRRIPRKGSDPISNLFFSPFNELTTGRPVLDSIQSCLDVLSLYCEDIDRGGITSFEDAGIRLFEILSIAEKRIQYKGIGSLISIFYESKTPEQKKILKPVEKLQESIASEAENKRLMIDVGNERMNIEETIDNLAKHPEQMTDEDSGEILNDEDVTEFFQKIREQWVTMVARYTERYMIKPRLLPEKKDEADQIIKNFFVRDLILPRHIKDLAYEIIDAPKKNGRGKDDIPGWFADQTKWQRLIREVVSRQVF